MVLLALLALAAAETYPISDFHSKWFWKIKSAGLYDVSTGMELTELQEEGAQVLEIIDIDGDNYNDLLTLTSDAKRFRIHFYDEHAYEFESRNVYSLDKQECKIGSIKALPGRTVFLVFLCVENPDEQYLLFADLPILQKADNQTEFHQELKRALFSQEQFAPEEQSIRLGTTLITKGVEPYNAPYFVDINGDALTDIFYTMMNTASPITVLKQHLSKNGTREWTEKPFSAYTTDMGGICKSQHPSQQLSSPHFNAYQDVNSDCVPDLLLTTFLPGLGVTLSELYLQVKDTTGEYKFCLVYSEQMADAEQKLIYGSPVLTDLNKDGSVDIVYSYTIPDQEQVGYKAFFNKLKSKKASAGADLCYDPVELTASSPDLNMFDTIKDHS